MVLRKLSCGRVTPEPEIEALQPRVLLQQGGEFPPGLKVLARKAVDEDGEPLTLMGCLTNKCQMMCSCNYSPDGSSSSYRDGHVVASGRGTPKSARSEPAYGRRIDPEREKPIQ